MESGVTEEGEGGFDEGNLIFEEEEDEEDEDDLASTNTEDEISMLIDESSDFISDLEMSFTLWDGADISDDNSLVALDCITSEYNYEGELILIGCSTGIVHCFVEPNQFHKFVDTHKNCKFIFHDNAKQFFLLSKIVEGNEEIYELWWEKANQSQIRDCMILDSLIRLALLDADPSKGQDIRLIGLRYLRLSPTMILELCSENTFLGKYKDILDVPNEQWWSSEFIHHFQQYFQAAIRKPIVIALSYLVMLKLSRVIWEKHKADIREDSWETFGPLSETIQVRASMALLDIHRNGIVTDLARAKWLRNQLLKKIKLSTNAICLMENYCAYFNLESGQKLNSKKKTLENLLLQAREEIKIQFPNADILPVPLNSQGQISLSTKQWGIYSSYHSFIHHWTQIEKACKYLQFVEFHSPVSHSKYTTLVRNGRASASRPNIQQMPRDGGYREIFCARENHVFVICDYSFIELCTLAVVCERKFGFSMLANVIRKGIDPHCFTAAMFEKVTLDEFMTWKDSENPDLRSKFKNSRQRAKAINFGIPGGEGAVALKEYAKSAYQVELTLEESERFREILIHEVYPELSLYLFEDCMDILAKRLGVPVAACWKRFAGKRKKSPAIALAIRNILAGKLYKSNGRPYQEKWVQSVWRTIQALNKNPALAPLIERYYMTGNENLSRKLFGSEVATITGRVRGGITFTQGCNTPFSGLASDGAKLSLFNLLHIGYRLVAFIHDEIVVEIPDSSDFDKEAKIINDVMCESMQQVTKNMPIKCEYSVSRRWCKGAVPVYKDGKLTIWEPTDNYELPNE